jgi:ribosomal protein L29
MTKMEDIKKKSDSELATAITAARKTIQDERFKDNFSKKPAVIQAAKKDVARGLTELSARLRINNTK